MIQIKDHEINSLDYQQQKLLIGGNGGPYEAPPLDEGEPIPPN